MANYKIIKTGGSLSHHGIKGMKWGVRRYRNPDGTLTEAGKKRYGEEGKSLLDRYVKVQNSIKKAKNSGEYSYDLDKAAKLNKAKELAKSDIKNQAIRKKLREGKLKESKRMQKLTERYMSEGMSEEDAKIKAYKRARVEKAIAIGAGLTLAAAAGIAGYAIYKDRHDVTLKAGHLLSRVANNDNNSLHPVFYASDDKKKFANKMYTGMYANQHKMMGSNDVYKKTLELKDHVKVASNKHASDTLRDLLANDKSMGKDLASSLKDTLDGRPQSAAQRREVKKALKALDAGKYNRHVYNAFNYHGANSSDKFINALRNKGYDALNDINDQKLSGYAAKTARIYFNNNKIGVKDVNKLSDNKIASDFMAANARVLGRQLGKKATIYGGIYGSVKGAKKVIDKHTDSVVVKNYRKEHPGTKLSDNDILRMHHKIK